MPAIHAAGRDLPYTPPAMARAISTDTRPDRRARQLGHQLGARARQPLKLMLDGLAGNPEMVKATSLTWKNIGNELKRLGKHYTAAVNAGTGGWHGSAGAAYREKTAKNLIDAMEVTGTLALTMSVVVGSMGEIVNMVRSAVRDMVGEVVGMPASGAAQKFLACKPPLAELQQIAETVKKCKKLLDIMLAVIDLGPMVPVILEVYKTVTAIIPKLDGI